MRPSQASHRARAAEITAPDPICPPPSPEARSSRSMRTATWGLTLRSTGTAPLASALSATCTSASPWRCARVRWSPAGRSACTWASTAVWNFSPPTASRCPRKLTDPSACREIVNDRSSVGSGSGPSGSSRARKCATASTRSACGCSTATAENTASIAPRSTPWAAARARGPGATARAATATCSADTSPAFCASASAGRDSSARPLRTTRDASDDDSRQCPRSHDAIDFCPSRSGACDSSAARTARASAASIRLRSATSAATSSRTSPPVGSVEHTYEY